MPFGYVLEEDGEALMSKVEIRRRAPDKRKVRAPGRIPASETNLTVKERAMLPDPDWVTEDDADDHVLAGA